MPVMVSVNSTQLAPPSTNHRNTIAFTVDRSCQIFGYKMSQTLNSWIIHTGLDHCKRLLAANCPRGHVSNECTLRSQTWFKSNILLSSASVSTCCRLLLAHCLVTVAWQREWVNCLFHFLMIWSKCVLISILGVSYKKRRHLGGFWQVCIVTVTWPFHNITNSCIAFWDTSACYKSYIPCKLFNLHDMESGKHAAATHVLWVPSHFSALTHIHLNAKAICKNVSRQLVATLCTILVQDELADRKSVCSSNTRSHWP